MIQPRPPRPAPWALPLLAVSLAAPPAHARPPKPRTSRRGRALDTPGPFGRGTLLPSLALGGTFSSSFSVLRFGAGLTYFFLYGLGLGLSLDDTVTIYGKGIRADFPGIEKQVPTNVLLLTPSVTWVFVRRPRFSPYVSAGVGPVFFNNGGGVQGRWVASGGAYIGLGERAFLSLGVTFSSMFPARACRDAFDYTDPSGNTGRIFRTTPCNFAWGPTIGLGFSFGSGRRRVHSTPRPAPAPAAPAAPDPAPAPPPPVEPPPAELPPPADPPPPVEPHPSTKTPPPVETPPPTDTLPSPEPPPSAETPPPADPPPSPEPPPSAETPPPADPPPSPEPPPSTEPPPTVEPPPTGAST